MTATDRLTLSAFLLARIEEDERVAQQWETHGYGSRTPPHWQMLFNGVDQLPGHACDPAARRVRGEAAHRGASE